MADHPSDRITRNEPPVSGIRRRSPHTETIGARVAETVFGTAHAVAGTGTA